jgi:hypothetical protein
MLVVDGVELELGDEVAHIGYLDHRDAARLEYMAEPGGEAIGVRNVCDDGVRVNDVGGATAPARRP